jgi:hypothetical protein
MWAGLNETKRYMPTAALYIPYAVPLLKQITMKAPNIRVPLTRTLVFFRKNWGKAPSRQGKCTGPAPGRFRGFHPRRQGQPGGTPGGTYPSMGYVPQGGAAGTEIREGSTGPGFPHRGRGAGSTNDFDTALGRSLAIASNVWINWPNASIVAH